MIRDVTQVGFDASNDNLYYAWSTSRTAAVANIDDGSNVGLTGRYLFRVDGTTVDDYSASSVGKMAAVDHDVISSRVGKTVAVDHGVSCSLR